MDYKLPKIRDYNGDISKRWCVYWFEKNPNPNSGRKLIRKVEWISASIKNREDRYLEANEIKRKITQKLTQKSFFDIQRPERNIK